MKVNPIVILLGAAAAVALLNARRSGNGGGGGGGTNGGDPNDPNVVPVTPRESRGYEVIGYDPANMQAARIAFAGDVAPVAIAFRIGPAGDAASRAVQFASFALGRASNMTTEERLAVVRYLDTGEATAALPAGISKATSAWRGVVQQVKSGTSGSQAGLSSDDQIKIQLRAMYALGYLTLNEFKSVLGKSASAAADEYPFVKAAFNTEANAVLAKYNLFGGNLADRAVLYLALVTNYAKLSQATSKQVLDEVNQAQLNTAPQIGTQTRNVLITVRNVLLASA